MKKKGFHSYNVIWILNLILEEERTRDMCSKYDNCIWVFGLRENEAELKHLARVSHAAKCLSPLIHWGKKRKKKGGYATSPIYGFLFFLS